MVYVGWIEKQFDSLQSAFGLTSKYNILVENEWELVYLSINQTTFLMHSVFETKCLVSIVIFWMLH